MRIEDHNLVFNLRGLTYVFPLWPSAIYLAFAASGVVMIACNHLIFFLGLGPIGVVLLCFFIAFVLSMHDEARSRFDTDEKELSKKLEEL